MFSCRGNFVTQGTWWQSGGIDYHDVRGGILLYRGQAGTEHPTMHRTAPQNHNYCSKIMVSLEKPSLGCSDSEKHIGIFNAALFKKPNTGNSTYQ
jgi:hypothetical protein